jgi:hypothetical protein
MFILENAIALIYFKADFFKSWKSAQWATPLLLLHLASPFVIQ